MPLVMGQQGRLAWAHFYESVSDDEIERYANAFVELGQTADRDGPGFALAMMKDGDPPTSTQRQMMASVIENNREALSGIDLFVYAFESRLARGVVTAVSWLAPKPFPERVTSSFNAACAELSSQHTALDVDALWTNLVAAVPAEHLIRRR